MKKEKIIQISTIDSIGYGIIAVLTNKGNIYWARVNLEEKGWYKFQLPDNLNPEINQPQ